MKLFKYCCIKYYYYNIFFVFFGYPTYSVDMCSETKIEMTPILQNSTLLQAITFTSLKQEHLVQEKTQKPLNFHLIKRYSISQFDL